MHRHFLISTNWLLATLAIILLTSCSESEEIGEYHDWKERNQHFIDSIANEAAINADGNWLVLKDFTIGDSSELYLNQPNYFVYAKRVKDGEGTYSPLYNDSVRVHYSGRLMPTPQHPQGFNFDKSYSTSTLNEETDVPTLFCVNQLTLGFATTLMHMNEGDRWIVYIPYTLGYGTSDYTSSTIPAYSTLIFDIMLARVYRYGIDTDTSWH